MRDMRGQVEANEGLPNRRRSVESAERAGLNKMLYDVPLIESDLDLVVEDHVCDAPILRGLVANLVLEIGAE